MKIDGRAAVFFDRLLVDAKTSDGGVVESDAGQFDVPMEWRLLLPEEEHDGSDAYC